MGEMFTIKLAGQNIGIAAINGYVREYCRDYLTEDRADFDIAISPSDIEYERERSAAEDKKEGIPTRQFSDSYLETLAVYRKIADKMLDYDTILFHGSVVAVDGVGYLFTAKSGTGKSTHTRLWREMLGERAVMINDDKPLISLSKSGIMVHGTPWDGKHRLSTNTSVPLRAICILERAEENRIVPITKKDAYNMLMQQVYRPTGVEGMMKTLALIDRLAAGVKLYRLGCNMYISAAITAYNGMKG